MTDTRDLRTTARPTPKPSGRRRPNYGHVELPRVEIGPPTLAQYMQGKLLQSFKVAKRLRTQRNALLWGVRSARELIAEGDVAGAVGRLHAAERRHEQLMDKP